MTEQTNEELADWVDDYVYRHFGLKPDDAYDHELLEVSRRLREPEGEWITGTASIVDDEWFFEEGGIVGDRPAILILRAQEEPNTTLVGQLRK